MAKPNRIKAAIRDGRKAHGVNMTMAAPGIVEILGTLDLDYIYVDGEHGPFAPGEVEEICRAADLCGMTPIARVPDISSPTIGRFLDRGVQGIIGPHITSREDAEQLVRACYFAPLGERSYGSARGNRYGQVADRAADLRDCNDQLLVGAMFEDALAVANLDDILTVDGIDIYMIGPMDFAQGQGYPGDPGHPRVRRAMGQLARRVRAAGRLMREDVMVPAWDRDIVIEGARRLLKRPALGAGG